MKEGPIYCYFTKEQRGQGYGFEAVSLICKFVFMNWAYKIRLAVNSNNQNAIHVYEKVGFKKKELIEKRYFKMANGWISTITEFYKRVATND